MPGGKRRRLTGSGSPFCVGAASLSLSVSPLMSRALCPVCLPVYLSARLFVLSVFLSVRLFVRGAFQRLSDRLPPPPLCPPVRLPACPSAACAPARLRASARPPVPAGPDPIDANLRSMQTGGGARLSPPAPGSLRLPTGNAATGKREGWATGERS